MRALRFHGDHRITVDDVPEPGPPGPGQVLVRPLMCGICGTDLHEYTGGPIVIPASPHPLTGASMPQILGHEFSAVVVAAGDGAGHLRAGQLCTIMPLITCGHCDLCVRGQGHLCRTMACTGLSSAWGGIADLAIVSAAQVVPVPETMTAQQAALIEPTAVAAYGVDRGGLRPGQTVLVTGAGPIGSLADDVRAGRRGAPGGGVRARPVAPGPGQQAGRGHWRGNGPGPGRRACRGRGGRPHRRARRRPGDRVRRARERAGPVHRRRPPGRHRRADGAAYPARLDLRGVAGRQGPDPGGDLVLPGLRLPPGRRAGRRGPAPGRAGDQLGGLGR